jgi:hypothetical protein
MQQPELAACTYLENRAAPLLTSSSGRSVKESIWTDHQIANRILSVGKLSHTVRIEAKQCG